MSGRGCVRVKATTKSVDEAFAAALRAHQAGWAEEAATAYERILRERPDYAGAWHLLGLVCRDRGDLERAGSHIHRAIALDSSKAVYHNNLGVVLRGQGWLEEAEAAYRKALSIKQDYADAWSNLGLVLQEQGRHQEAIAAFRQAIGINPGHPDALYNLGNLYQDLGEIKEAIRCYHRALEVQPSRAAIHNNLGNALLAEKRTGEAIAHYQRALALDASYAEAHLNLGMACAEEDRVGEAARCYMTASRLRPERTIWAMRSASLCPAVFQDAVDVERYREDLERRLDAFQQTPLELDWRTVLVDGFIPSFHLAHHGQCNRRLKEKFAAIFAPHFPKRPTETPRAGGSRARIGFVVTREHEGGFLRGTSGIIEYLDRDRFEPVVLCSQSILEVCRQGVHRQDVTWVPLSQRFSDAVEQIASAGCDVLDHWQIGTDPLNYFLPFARLAPVQCTGFGTHGTTGIAAVDYFLSSRLFEPQGGEEHYTESLYPFRTIPTYQRRAAPPPPARRSVFGLPEEGHLYFCPQRLSKFHPGFDCVLRDILQGDPQGHLVLLKGRHEHAVGQLRLRFDKTLGRAASRVVFLPPQRPADYYRLLSLADVLLDPPHYSSSLTGYDAFALGLPLVTLPGDLMVQRYALGLYRKMGFEDLVVRTPEEYSALAVRLGTDGEYRRWVSCQIAQRSGALFDDLDAVREYEEFLEHVLSRGED